MSKEIKMSDVFSMNTTIVNATGEGFLLKDNNCEYRDEYLAIIFDLNQARAITHAINNHDRLIGENKRLKQALSLIMNTFSLFTDDDILQKESQTVKHSKSTRPPTTEYINKKV